MSYKDYLLYEACQKGKQIKTLFLVKTLFPPQDPCNCSPLICLVQPKLCPLVGRGMDLS